jgi:hypothetical protein
MTVYISADAKNLREELASLRNQGGYQEQQFYFDGLFADKFVSTGWSTSTTTISGTSSLIFTWGASNSYAYKAFLTETGKKYAINITFSGTTPRLYVSASGVSGSPLYVAGPVSGTNYLFTATQNYMFLGLAQDTGSTTITGIFISEVDANDDVVHRLPKGWKPKDVFEDGLLQREGAAHDYEVVYDGFDYYVKPAVAPSATTQTCVIGVKA